MDQSDELTREIRALRERLSRLSEASLRINESLDFDTVLQGVLDSARSLTGARYGVITLRDDGGRIQDFLSSGMTAEEARRLWEMPDGMGLFESLGSITEPLRVRDLLGHVRSLGLSGVPPARGGGSRGALPGRAGLPPGPARRRPLRGREGGRGRVQPGR